jgi:hypothetical protein
LGSGDLRQAGDRDGCNREAMNRSGGEHRASWDNFEGIPTKYSL